MTLPKTEGSLEIANTKSASKNRVFMSAMSLLLNVEKMGVEDISLQTSLQTKK